jgi:predicted phosphodiesterase
VNIFASSILLLLGHLLNFIFMKVLFVGDVHGNTRFAVYAISVAHELGISHVVQVGDFGIWPGRSGAEFLTGVSVAARQFDVKFGFIDGNHEDFDQLDRALKNFDREPDGSIYLLDNVLWYPRGTVLDLGGRRFGFLGGAVSVDRSQRTKFVSWWPQETITERDLIVLENNLKGQPVDVLVTHDVPACVVLPFPASTAWPSDVLRESEQQRVMLDTVASLARPKTIIHGHWHATYHALIEQNGNPFDVYGLCGDTGAEPSDGLGVLDTETLEFVFLGEANKK